MVRSKIDRTWSAVGVGGSTREYMYSLGKRIKLVLANSLIHYLSSSLRGHTKTIIRSNKPWTNPISPPRRNYEIAPSPVGRVTDRP